MLSPPNKQKPRSRHLGIKLFLVLLWFVALGLVAVNRQAILDWWKLRSYQAPAEIAQLATQDTMTDYSRKVFYVNQPALVNKSDFATRCPNAGGEKTIVLGCYHSGQSGIYLLDVTDPRLEGVEQVTAAHEMLHAAYERLNSEERQKVDKLLQAYYDNGLTNERIRQTVESYKQSEPTELLNEMHSIFGTEVAQLPAELEAYYKRYLADRSKVTAFAAQYDAAFTSRKAERERIAQQLTDLKTQLDSRKAEFGTQKQNLETMYQDLISKRDSGDIAAYNAGVTRYNNLLDEHRGTYSEIQTLVARHNELVERHNALAFEEGQLYKELGAPEAPANN